MFLISNKYFTKLIRKKVIFLLINVKNFHIKVYILLYKRINHILIPCQALKKHSLNKPKIKVIWSTVFLRNYGFDQ